jgi:hypothetical protein
MLQRNNLYTRATPLNNPTMKPLQNEGFFGGVKIFCKLDCDLIIPWVG